MTTYSLTVNVDLKYVEQFGRYGYKICVASGVAKGDKTYFNLLASATDFQPTTTITWTDEYSMASVDGQDSTMFDEIPRFSTDPQDIQLGQAFTLASDWMITSVASSPNAPSNGFLFINETTQSACALLRKFNGSSVPVYTSAGGLMGLGQEALIPTSQILVFFQLGDTELGSAVPDGTTRTVQQNARTVVDFQGFTNRTIIFNKYAQWEVRP